MLPGPPWTDSSARFSGGAEGGRDREVQERPEEAPRRDDLERRGQVKEDRFVPGEERNHLKKNRRSLSIQSELPV